MLLTIATCLIAVWGVGVATSHTLHGYIHVALFCAGVAIFVRFLIGTSQSYSRLR
jgi:Family of unknown function (DUF5670)